MNDENELVVRDAATDFHSIDRLLDSVFHGTRWAPAVDILESDSEVKVFAALPGLAKSDVNVELKENTLVISGRAAAPQDEKAVWARRELPRGEFVRAFTLPADVQSGKITATMKDGVLEIRMPKVEEAKPRKIAIE